MARPNALRVLLLVTFAWMAWAGWTVVSGEAPVGVIAVDDTGAPVRGAVVTVDGEEVGLTDGEGRIEVEWRPGSEIFITAPGFHPTPLAIPEAPADGDAMVVLEPYLLRGRVVDGEGRPVSGVRVVSGVGEDVTTRDGRFMVRRALPGDVKVIRPAWEASRLEWDGSPGAQRVQVEPKVVRAVHVTGEAAADPGRWQEMLAMVEETELNGVMLDLKDEYGLLYYDTGVDLAHQVDAVRLGFDLNQLAADLEERGIYLIGRIVTFQDPLVAQARPELAVTDTSTGGPYNRRGQYFLDPTDPEARAYALALAEEACRLGVDEIQFDYVRYPDGFGPEASFDGGSDAETRVETIRRFLAEARQLLNPEGCAVAGDIFGFLTTATDDGGIGQQWEVVTDVLDVASPMVYPSHYGPGWYGFDHPVDHPRQMVTRALEDGLARLDSGTVVRPWLQDFNYTPEQVRAQIEAAERFGLGWMLWHPKSDVTEEALDPE